MSINELIECLKLAARGLTTSHGDRDVVVPNGSGGVANLTKNMVLTVRDADYPAEKPVCFIGNPGDMPDNLVEMDNGTITYYYSRVVSRLVDRLEDGDSFGAEIADVARDSIACPGGPREKICDLVERIDKQIDVFFHDSFNESQYNAKRVEEAALNAKHSIRLHLLAMVNSLKYQDMPPVSNTVDYFHCERNGCKEEDDE